MSLRDQILGSKDLPLKSVKVPEWSCDVYVRTITAAERDAFEQRQLELSGGEERKNIVGIRARLVVLCACDDAGKPIFTEADVPSLNELSAKAVNRVFNVAAPLNG